METTSHSDDGIKVPAIEQRGVRLPNGLVHGQAVKVVEPSATGLVVEADGQLYKISPENLPTLEAPS